jgi:hypothetical protein
MKILILALPRTGSTSLLFKIGNEKNLTIIYEPFDGSGRSKYNPNSDNVIVKTMIFHKYEDNKPYIETHLNLCKEFDKIILLTRKNLKVCAESWAYLQYHIGRNFNSVKHYKWELTPNFEDEYKNILKWNEEINEISKILNIKLTYYEDIYDVNSPEKYRKQIEVDKLI